MKNGLDSYYTPAKLAEILLSHATQRKIRSVADFCVGGGELLLAAQRKFPNVTCYGCDISNDAISTLKQKYTNWSLKCCDFLSNKRITSNNFDLIVLNPPFSCRGSIVRVAFIDDVEFHVSTAMQFLIQSLRYMNEDSELLAILPISILTSQKDRKALFRLHQDYTIRVIEERSHEYFVTDCAPNIVLVSIKKRVRFEKLTIPDIFPNKKIPLPILSVERGRLPIHKIVRVKRKRSGTIRLIHTTNLKNNKVVDCSYIKTPLVSVFNGPALLIPRVCHPNIEKVAIIEEGESFAASDCIIVMPVESNETAWLCQNKIIENWEMIKQIYRGTGAFYTTIELVEKMFLNKF